MDSAEQCGCGLDPCECALTPTERSAFNDAVDALNAAVAMVRRRLPTASVYVQIDNMNLMSGPQHTGEGEGRPDRVLASRNIPGCDCGDW